MTETLSSRRVSPQDQRQGRAGAAPARTHDCDTCVVGDDASGLAIALDLARAGRDVLCLTLPPEPMFALDGTFAPGFALTTSELVERVGMADAQELLILSAEAAERGLAFAERSGVSVGPRGRLSVARPHAAQMLAAEHELRQELAPDTTILVGPQDLGDLLGTSAFALGLGVVPAERVAPGALVAALRAAAESAGVRFMPVEGALAADLQGVRKYLSAADWRVRAFQVAVCGPQAFERLGSRRAPLVRVPWVGGVFEASGLEVPYQGLVEEIGLTGLRYHFDGSRLAFAAATATPVATRGGAARVLRRHAGEVYPGAVTHAEGARACPLAETAGMPQVYEGERGVWYALSASGDPLSHALLAARLITGAIVEKDDRIALLQPFAAPPLQGWAGRVARFAAYWHVRLAAHLHMDRLERVAAGVRVSPDEGAVAAQPEPSAARPRRSLAGTSRHAARAALHAASGWASGLAARAAARPSRRRALPEDEQEETPPQRR